MNNRIPAQSNQTPATPRTDAPTAPTGTPGVKPETLASFSPAERDAAEQMLAAYRTAISRNREG